MKHLLLLFISCGAWLIPCRGYAATPLSDTTEIAIHLDSAFKMMKKSDPQAVTFLITLLKSSRTTHFKRGEGEALFCLGEFYSITGKLGPSKLYFDSALVIFEDIALQGRRAQTYNMLGTLQIMQNQYAQSIPNFKKAAEINLAVGRKQNLGDCYFNLGSVYSNLGDYTTAVQFFINVLEVDLEIDFKAGLAGDYEQIGSMYVKIGDIQKALENYQKALEVSEASEDNGSIAAALTGYGVILKNLKRFDEADKMLDRALTISLELKSDRRIAIAFHNLASLYNAEGNYSKAIDYYQKSLSYNVVSTVQANYEGLAEVNFKLKKYILSLDFAKKSLQMANEAKSMGRRQDLNLLMSTIYEGLGNHQKALEYYKTYSILKDSLLDTDKSKQVQNLQAKYETDKKEQEIATLTSQQQLQSSIIRQKNVIQYVLIGGLLILIVFGLITFRIFKDRQEARRLLLAEQVSNEHKEAERLKELDHMKSRFFANIAHEFRTPLTLILGPVENLIGETKNTNDKNQLIVVKNNASRLVKLVNQLLDLSKLEAGAIKLDYVSEDIIPFLKANTFAFQSIADQKNIKIKFNSITDSLIMRFDRDKLEKIFSNLLSNAFKFTPTNGSVNVTATVAGDTVRITVKDSGYGIPEADLPYVFNRFYQSGKVVRSTAGSGIGLELTKELVEICGGLIGVHNPASGGAEFYFTLPIPEAEKNDQNISYQKSTQANINLEDARANASLIQNEITSESEQLILIIEDNEEVRDFIVSSLQSGYQIITAVNGEDGITKALEAIPDLIITDVMMPVKDGLDVCRTLKEDEKTSHIPVIMLTAKADIESKIEGLQTGADDYLAKPFHTKELLVRMQNLIAQRQKLREKFSVTDSEPIKEKEELPLREKLFFNRLNEIIELHLAEEEYSIEDLSRDMAMSRMQLHRKLKALTTTSTSLYIRSIRLNHGKRMLEEGLYNVSEVAYLVGFNSPTYFSTCFSEQFGFPPSEVKKHLF